LLFINKNKGNKKLSEDLTVVLLRGNGSPRAFRLNIPYLQRSLLLLGATIAVLLIIALGASGIAILKKESIQIPFPMMEKDEASKETQGLRDDIAKLQQTIEDRKALPEKVEDRSSPIRLLSATTVLAPDAEATLKIKNAVVTRTGGDMKIGFEIHNTDTTQKQVRGYIVVLAKSKNFILTYPDGAFSPTENVLLNFTRGETFAISRFRTAMAEFHNVPPVEGHIHFQVFLFSTLGKIITTMHLEEGK
jgi:hypothetical protein